MKYSKVVKATFIERPNRFVAKVRLENGDIETVHVKNTGRCKEILLPGTEVYLEKAADDKVERKTAYDLVTAVKENFGLINIDSQAPNKIAYEWLLSHDYDLVRPEYKYGNSRIDFYMEKGKKKFLMEVKGCTLERNGIGYFPDAPTARGRKHIYELIGAKKAGYHAILAYVIQMDNVNEVRPNTETDPEYAKAIVDAKKAGVEILFIRCHVKSDEVTAV